MMVPIKKSLTTAALMFISVSALSAAHAGPIGNLTVTDIGSANSMTTYPLLTDATIVSSINAPIAIGTSLSTGTTKDGNGTLGWNPLGNGSNPSQWLSIGGANGTSSIGGESSAILTMVVPESVFSLIWGSSSVTNTISLFSGTNGTGTLLGTVTATGGSTLDIVSNGASGVLTDTNLINSTGPGAIIDIASTIPIGSVELTTQAGDGGFEIAGISGKPVPLPATLYFLTPGLLALGFIVNQRRRKARAASIAR
jgi:hypothetical protein